MRSTRSRTHHRTVETTPMMVIGSSMLMMSRDIMEGYQPDEYGELIPVDDPNPLMAEASRKYEKAISEAESADEMVTAGRIRSLLHETYISRDRLTEQDYQRELEARVYLHTSLWSMLNSRYVRARVSGEIRRPWE